jgi:NAD(P)-dependent dehydrogenase (short-subunit alcohol dehydrogenase family)
LRQSTELNFFEKRSSQVRNAIYHWQNLCGRIGPRGIRVNVIIPGPVKTQISKKGGQSEQLQKNFEEATIAKSPLKRFATADEVARLVRFLLSEDSSYILGSEVIIDGGFRLA